MGKAQRNLKRTCGRLGPVSAELLPPLGQRDEHRQQLPDPRRRKACLEWNRGLWERDAASLRQPLGVEQRE